jgi:hypothetical protein
MRKFLLAVVCTAGLATAANAQGRSIYVEQSGTRPTIAAPGRTVKSQSSSSTDVSLKHSDTAEVKKSTRVETGKEATSGATVAPGM